MLKQNQIVSLLTLVNKSEERMDIDDFDSESADLNKEIDLICSQNMGDDETF